jgi:hypothetical protein
MSMSGPGEHAYMAKSAGTGAHKQRGSDEHCSCELGGGRRPLSSVLKPGWGGSTKIGSGRTGEAHLRSERSGGGGKVLASVNQENWIPGVSMVGVSMYPPKLCGEVISSSHLRSAPTKLFNVS